MARSTAYFCSQFIDRRGLLVDLSLAGNVVAATADGSAVPAGGIDGRSDDYSATLLGSTLLWSGTTFQLPAPGQSAAVHTSIMSLPPQAYSTLSMLAASVNGSQPDSTLTISYIDESSTAIKQSFSDWHAAQAYPNESIAKTMAYRLDPNGSQHAGIYNVYGYTFALDPTKVVSSITLPNSPNVVALAVSVAP